MRPLHRIRKPGPYNPGPLGALPTGRHCDQHEARGPCLSPRPSTRSMMQTLAHQVPHPQKLLEPNRLRLSPPALAGTRRTSGGGAGKRPPHLQERCCGQRRVGAGTGTLGYWRKKQVNLPLTVPGPLHPRPQILPPNEPGHSSHSVGPPNSMNNTPSSAFLWSPSPPPSPPIGAEAPAESLSVSASLGGPVPPFPGAPLHKAKELAVAQRRLGFLLVTRQPHGLAGKQQLRGA